MCRNRRRCFDTLYEPTITQEVPMRKITAGLFVSLDGVAEAPDGWHLPFLTEEWSQLIGTRLPRADALLLGRRTFAGYLPVWPPQGTSTPMAAFMNNTRKYVVSSTLDSVEQFGWANSTLLTGDFVEQVTALKQGRGGDIVVLGSPTIVQELLDQRLLDELTLTICPIVIGGGMRLFDKTTGRVSFRVSESHALANGVQVTTYEPVTSG
jgi:dihydrofolate reductase